MDSTISDSEPEIANPSFQTQNEEDEMARQLLDQVVVKKTYVVDPNAKGLVQGVAGGLGASKERAKKVKEATEQTRQDLRDHGAGPWIIHPDAPWLRLWDFLQAMVITYLFVELPIRFAFINTQLQLQTGRIDDPKELYTSLDIVVDVLMCLDFILKFFRAYYDHDYHGVRHLHVKLSEIAKHYFAGSLVRDIFACLPLDTVVTLLGHPQSASAVRLLRLMRVERVVSFKRTVDSYVDRSVGRGWLRPVVSGVSLVLGTMFFNHVLCCVLYIAGSEIYDEPGCGEYEQNRCGWVNRMEYRPDTGLLTRYTDSFYFTFTILTTVGFGDITAHSTVERMTTVVAMTAGCAIFGIVMGQITAVIHGMNMGLQHYEERVRELEQYMQFRNVNHTVRERVKRFIVEKFPEKRVYDERAILNCLPLGLRTEFQMDMYMEHVTALPFFPSDDHEVLVRICQIIREEVIMPGEIVVREGTRLRNAFTVVSGKIKVQIPNLDSSRASLMRPASWMLSDEELLKTNLQWSQLDANEAAREQEAVQASGRKKALQHLRANIIVVEATQAIKRPKDAVEERHPLDISPSDEDDEDDKQLEWLTLAVLQDSHYFCEQCLSYDTPSLKRYMATSISTIGVIDKDGCEHLMAEYPVVRHSVREYVLIKFQKICSRITRHLNGEWTLPPAALIDSRFEANMMYRVIKGWGGAQMIVETAHKNETEAYLSVIERTYAAFKPPEFGPQFNPDMEDLAQNQVQNQNDDAASMSDMERILSALQRIEEAHKQLAMKVDADHHRITTIQREVHDLAVG